MTSIVLKSLVKSIVLWSSFLFLYHWISIVFVFFTTEFICTHSLDPLFITIGEFQVWYPLPCGPRGRAGVHTTIIIIIIIIIIIKIIVKLAWNGGRKADEVSVF